MKKAKSTRRSKAAKPADSKLEQEALEMLKSSGILKRNVSLDQMMKLSTKLTSVSTARGAFIFRDFLYRPC